jgi:putative ABC transport system permease protein
VAAGFVGLRVMTRSLEGEIDVWSREAFRDKVFVSELPETDFDALARHLHGYPGVVGVEPNEARTYAPFLVIGLDEQELAGWGPCADDPELVRLLREERGIVLSRRIAKHREYALGDLVHIEAADGDVESFPVVAISDAYGYFPHPDERLYGVISDRWMQRMYCMDVDRTTQVAVRMDGSTSPEDAEVLVRTAIAELLPGSTPRIENGHYLYDWHSKDIARDFVLFDIIILLTVVLAGLGVLNGQLLSALERAKELGVLKALGTTRRQVAGMVLLESGVVGLIGGGLGAALGALLGPFIVGALEVISGLELPQRGPGAHLLWAWLAAVLVSLLAGLYPIWRMNRADAIAAVRTGG